MLRIAMWAALLVVNGPGVQEPSDRLTPASWGGNPWGPAATQARQAGTLPPVAMTPRMRQWDRWGRAILRDGDIVFRRGNARVLFGYFPFSRFTANVSGSTYSHTGIVALEQGAPFVYDITRCGVRRQPFCVWSLDNAGAIGVKRLRPDQQSHVAEVTRFCRDAYERQVPFDFNLDPGDAALYCVEMTEKAFRAAGLELSQPVRLRDMERFAEFPICVATFLGLSYVTLDRPLSLDQPVFFPGNARHGIWSSPLLEPVYPPAPSRSTIGQGTPATRDPRRT